VTGSLPVPISLLRNTPFDSFLIPGLFLGIIIGGSAAAAALASLARTRRSLHLSGAAGVILIGWIAGETILIEAFSWLQGLYLLTGVLVVALSWHLAPGTWHLAPGHGPDGGAASAQPRPGPDVIDIASDYQHRCQQNHLAYESLMERDRMLLADFDAAVTDVAAQPFHVSGTDGVSVSLP